MMIKVLVGSIVVLGILSLFQNRNNNKIGTARFGGHPEKNAARLRAMKQMNRP